MYYKRDNEILQQASEVYAPDFVLTPDTHATHQYPIDGWYWFDTLDEALAAMISPPDVPTVTALQGMRAIKYFGLAESFLAWKAGLDPVDDFEDLAFLDKAATWRYDNPTLDRGLVALGVLEQKPTLFTVAATL